MKLNSKIREIILYNLSKTLVYNSVYIQFYSF